MKLDEIDLLTIGLKLHYYDGWYGNCTDITVESVSEKQDCIVFSGETKWGKEKSIWVNKEHIDQLLKTGRCEHHNEIERCDIENRYQFETAPMQARFKFLVDKITEVAEAEGWSVYNCDEDFQYVNLEFTKHSPGGNEQVMSIQSNSVFYFTFVNQVEDYWNAYDPDYEAYLWIGDDGHGKNGAPYHIKDIVSNMEECDKMIGELYEAFNREDFDNFANDKSSELWEEEKN